MKCPFCQSEIDDKCIVCPVCTRDIIKGTNMKKMQKVNSYGSTDPIIWKILGIGIGIVVLAFLFAMMRGGCS